MVLFPGFGNGLWPFGMVEGIGIILGLQADAAALCTLPTALSGSVQEITGIELHTGAVGVDRHGTAGVGILQIGAGVAENLKIVVIAALELQRFVIRIDVPADGLGAAEIHGGTLHPSQFAGGDAFCITGVEEPGGEGQQLLHGGIHLFLACQIEVAVVGEIEHGIPVGNGIIHDVQTAAVVQAVGDLDGGLSGETLVSGGADELQCDGFFRVGKDRPEAGMVAVRAGMEVVGAFVGCQPDGHISQGEGAACDAVGAAAHGGTQEAAALPVTVGIVAAQYHVCHLSPGIGYVQVHQGGTVVSDGGSELAAGYGVQEGFFSGRQNAERFLHK